VVHSEILLPAEAPAWMADRSQLWNAVELGEKRKDSQVAREVEFAIPQELSQAEGIESRMAERAQELADSKSHGVGEGNCDAG
jgi:MobA/MobL family